MVGNGPFFFIGQDCILFLVTGNDDFDGFFQVIFRCIGSLIPDGAKGGLIDDIGEFRTRSAAGHAGDFFIIDVICVFDFLSMYAKDILPSFEVGEFHRHAPVKASGSGESRVQRLRSVGGSQDDDTVIAFKAVHLGQQLVQRLLSFIIAANLPVSLLADGIDFINEDDAGRLFLGLAKQIADLVSTHADEHFHKFRAGDREEGDACFTGYRLGKHCFTGTGRADEKHALRHLCAD